MTNLYKPSHLAKSQLWAILALLPRSKNKDYLLTANSILKENTIVIWPFGVVKYEDKIIWDEQRSTTYLERLHGHVFLGCLIDAYCESGDVQYIEKGIKLIKEWISEHNFENKKDTITYYSSAAIMRLSYWLLFYIYSKELLSSNDVDMLEKEMWKTAELLVDEGFYVTGTSQGLHQDITLLLYSLYFEKADERFSTDILIERIRDYLSGSYTAEGVHKEQSPSHHIMVTRSVKQLIPLLEATHPNISHQLKELYDKAEKFSTHIIKPDGVLPPIGDVEAIAEAHDSKLYDSLAYQYATSLGKEGEPSTQTDVVFPESGYAIFRNDWAKKEQATYLLFMAAYHIDAHKHNDDLSLYIYGNGKDCVAEAGYYNEQDSFTAYAKSSYAHNTLIVDGKGLPKADQQNDKVYISDYKISDTYSEVTGVNERYENVKHVRNVQYQKQENTIIVTDQINSQENHQYTLLWHIAKDIKVHVRDKFVEFFRNKKKVMEMEFKTTASLRINNVRGQTKPEIKGWFFPSVEREEETNVLEIELSGANVNCVTEIRLDRFKVGVEGRYPFDLEATYCSNRSVRYNFIPATDKAVSDQLVIAFSAMGEPYRFSYNYQRALENISCNKLFILDDFGDQGTYYLGPNRSLTVETAVMSLIQHIMSKHDVLHKNVTTVGTSKGGYCALYFSLKYHFGNTIIGAPATKTGEYLVNYETGRRIMQYTAGGTEAGDVAYLDNLLFQLLDQPSDTMPFVHLLVGTADPRYEKYIIPLCNLFEQRGFKYEVELDQNGTHGTLGTSFKLFVVRKLNQLLRTNVAEMEEIEKVTVSRLNDEFVIDCMIGDVEHYNYAMYVYKNNELVQKLPYGSNNKFQYSPTESGKYVFRMFAKNKESNKVMAKSSDQIQYVKPVV